MKILSLGSMNIDKTYTVDHIIRPKETIESSSYQLFCGGKGLNQSVALARAGAVVYHAGMVGSDGQMLTDMLMESGVHTDLIRVADEPTGHALIQIDPAGQNCIIISGGANRCITPDYIREALSSFEKGDVLLLQNEISANGSAIDMAREKGMMIVLNPSPYDGRLAECDFGKVDLFMVNEVEGRLMAGCESEDPDVIKTCLREKYPAAAFVLTLGEGGAVWFDASEEYRQPIFKVKAVDTTAAGDTFCGYFLAGLAQGLSVPECLKRASAASAISVSRQGAAPSIPDKDEVDRFLVR
ncbi:MAG: ribokinase [Blautia sp.]|nr:ribokinase [Blautia sp.]